MKSIGCTFVSCLALGLLSLPASAGSHGWDLWEVFSNADGTIQFIEMHEITDAANEIGLNGKLVTSEATGMEFEFPANIDPPTNLRYLLLATQGFADLPGAPTPDYIIPDGFFDPAGDTLRYHVYDTWVINKGQVPTDCVSSYNRDTTTGTPTPTNYAAETGEVSCKAPCPADLTGDNIVNAADLAELLGEWGPNPDSPADLNDDGEVNAADLAMLLGNWGPC